MPYDAYNFDIETTITNYSNINIPSILYPEQEGTITRVNQNINFTVPNTNVYTNVYPTQIARFVEDGYLHGDNHIVTIAVYPISYDANNNRLQLNKTIDITLKYSSGDGITNLLVKPLLRKNDIGRELAISSVKSIVTNAEDVSSNLAPISMNVYSIDSIKGYKYCIITTRDFANAFARLVAWKRMKGYDAGIICIEDILENPRFQNGDEISGINDNAGKLRAYLKYAYENFQTEYVLLGGKDPYIPIRYAYTRSSVIDPDHIVPTDMYFSDLNGNWNKNGNSYYGESSDGLDYNYEIKIGRLLCDSQEDIDNYTDKLLKYEISPGNGNFNYLNKSLCYFSIAGTSYGDKEEISESIEELFSENRYMHQDTFPLVSSPSGAEFVATLNENYNGFISMHAHGNPEGIQLVDDRPFVYGLNAIDNEKLWHDEEIGNGLDCLNNKNFPSIMYSISCTVMPFDNMSEYPVSINFGESFTLGKGYGGPAFLGNTRVGYFEYSAEMENLFLKEIINGKNIGEAEAESRRKYTHRHIRLTHNLLGDPEFMIWSQIPHVYSDVEISVNRMDNSIYVVGCGIEDCYVSAYAPDGNIYKYEMENNSDVNMTISPNSAIMIYGRNMIPYFPPLLIQNQVYEKSQYLFASSVQIGKFVDAERSSRGDVVFSNGVDFIIEATEDVLIDDGFVVESGASVTIRTKGRANIKGGLVKAGGKLSIEALDTVIKSPFIAENGAEIEFLTSKNQ